MEFEGCRALVKADTTDKKVVIHIQERDAANGNASEARRRLLAIIRSDFDHIHNSFKFEPAVEERVPIPGHPAVSLTHKRLSLLERKGHKTYAVDLDADLLEVNVQDMLNGVDLRSSRRQADRMERDSQGLNVFISYAHKDENLRGQLAHTSRFLDARA